MSHQYQNGSGQRQSNFKHDHYKVNTNQRHCVWLLRQLFRNNKEVNADSQQNGGAQANTFTTLRRNEEANKNQQTDYHARHEWEEKEEHGLASDRKRHKNLAEFTSLEVVFGLNLYASQRPVTVACGEIKLCWNEGVNVLVLSSR